MAPKQTPPNRTGPRRTAPNRTVSDRPAPNRRKPQPTEWQQDDHELPEAPFTGLIVEEVNVDAERKPQRATGRPNPSADARKSKPASARPETARPLRPKSEPAKSEPAKSERAKFAPVKSEPVSAEHKPPQRAARKSRSVEAAKSAAEDAVAQPEMAPRGIADDAEPEALPEIISEPIISAPILSAPIIFAPIAAEQPEPLQPQGRAPFSEEDEQAGERLQKLLARAGVASRRRAEELIAEGRVQVNGQVVTEPGSRALLGRDHVRVDGKLVQAAERMRYFVLNKPKGYVTTVSDPEGRPTVMDFFKSVRERVYPVGRLDYLSEGLLLVTNDGPLANGLTRAAHGVEKRYLVKVAGDPDEATLDTLRSGVVIERGRPGSGEGRVRTSPAQIRKVRQGDNPWFEVVLIEGRNRELRKMFEEIGHHVEKIRRVGYGPLELDQEPGKVRELDEEELRLLRLAAEGKWKPKRRREPIALPKEAGRSVRHDRGTRDSRGFTPSSGARFAGGSARPGTSRPGAPRPAWQDRERGERTQWSERPARSERAPGSGPMRSARPDGRSSYNDRPQRGATGERNSRERDTGGRSAGFQREGGFARPSRPAGSGRPAGSVRPGGQFRPAGPSRTRPDAGSAERAGAERGFSKPGAPRTGFSKPGFSKPGFSKPGFSKPGFSKPGFASSGSSRPGSSRSGSSRPGSSRPGSSRPAFGRTGPARPGSGKWRQEEEKPQPGGRNSTQKMGPDGKPREKKRWRDSFEGKSKGKPKWSGKQPGKPKSE